MSFGYLIYPMYKINALRDVKDVKDLKGLEKFVSKTLDALPQRTSDVFPESSGDKAQVEPRDVHLIHSVHSWHQKHLRMRRAFLSRASGISLNEIAHLCPVRLGDLRSLPRQCQRKNTKEINRYKERERDSQRERERV